MRIAALVLCGRYDRLIGLVMLDLHGLARDTSRLGSHSPSTSIAKRDQATSHA